MVGQNYLQDSCTLLLLLGGTELLTGLVYAVIASWWDRTTYRIGVRCYSFLMRQNYLQDWCTLLSLLSETELPTGLVYAVIAYR